jgi:hypothetical protein
LSVLHHLKPTDETVRLSQSWILPRGGNELLGKQYEDGKELLKEKEGREA